MDAKSPVEIHLNPPKSLEDLEKKISETYSFNLNKSVKSIKTPKKNCLICDEKIRIGVQLIRRCYTSIHDQCKSKDECSCSYKKNMKNEVHNACFKCLTKNLWTSADTGMKMIGRFRSTCPFCKNDYCHLDFALFSFKKSKKEKYFEKSKEKEVKYFTEKLKKFKNGEKKEMSFEPTLNSFQRRVVHDVAEQLNLKHFSQGKGKKRYITVRKKK